MGKKVHIIDCGLGNIRSVKNAFESIGCEVFICYRPEQLEDSEFMILPGVGAFGDGIDRLRQSKFDRAILNAVKSGRRLLGICLGMQLLFDRSYEFGEHEGLHLIPGEVKRMLVEKSNLRLPHIGWNDTFFKRKDDLLNGLSNPSCFYYINSYSCICNDQYILAEYEYGDHYAAVVRNGNIIGVQFHPEKSQKDGMNFLMNYLRI